MVKLSVYYDKCWDSRFFIFDDAIILHGVVLQRVQRTINCKVLSFTVCDLRLLNGTMFSILLLLLMNGKNLLLETVISLAFPVGRAGAAKHQS